MTDMAIIRSPLDMMTATDVHALRRVLRMCTRVLVEAANHVGHDDSCPFADPAYLVVVREMRAHCEFTIEAYEEVKGPVPHFPLIPPRDESAPPEA